MLTLITARKTEHRIQVGFSDTLAAFRQDAEGARAAGMRHCAIRAENVVRQLEELDNDRSVDQIFKVELVVTVTR